MNVHHSAMRLKTVDQLDINHVVMAIEGGE